MAMAKVVGYLSLEWHQPCRILAVVFSLLQFLNCKLCWFLQGERRISVLVGISLAFTIQVIGVYWWYQNDDLLYPLIMLPPRVIPPFWHAVFIIMVNGNLLLDLLLDYYCMFTDHTLYAVL